MVMNKFVNKCKVGIIPAIAAALSGCSSSVSDPYANATREVFEYNENQILNGLDTAGMTFHEVVASYLYQLTDYLKGVAPIIIVSSLLIGFLILMTVRRNMMLRKVAIFGFFIAFPFMTIFATYALAFLTSMFL